ncbi:acyl carrier protein [Mesorhizobium sp. Root554]|uniref:acyl carrier protein n=1 Tax=unclassified Mesorhizobium TaxID=325217 RepID=UPI0006FE592B|nr:MULTISPECIES: acyl carrier protein [unclassified Mesorhizobium]KQZ15507.1 acyl carrier protein [Mesorhizobium sp. Root1471]KQZ38016.1 acyl carrier protein [Mesorhizobium sp. Root554]
MKQRIRELLARHGGLSMAAGELRDDSDLYKAGLSSFASVQIMLAIEEAFDIEFPDALLNRRSFQSIDSIALAVESITGSAAAA